MTAQQQVKKHFTGIENVNQKDYQVIQMFPT